MKPIIFYILGDLEFNSIACNEFFNKIPFCYQYFVYQTLYTFQKTTSFEKALIKLYFILLMKEENKDKRISLITEKNYFKEFFLKYDSSHPENYLSIFFNKYYSFQDIIIRKDIYTFIFQNISKYVKYKDDFDALSYYSSIKT